MSVSLPSVLIRKSTGEILTRSLYPRFDMGPIEGLDPDLEWCVIRVPFEPPQYDGRYYQLNTTESRGDIPDTEFPHLYPWNVNYSTIKWDVAELSTQIVNRESDANNQLVLPYENLKLMVLGLGVLFRRVQGMTLVAKEQVIADRCLALALKVWKNHDRSTELKTQATAGQEPDLDAGWELP